MLSFQWWNWDVHLSAVLFACAKEADFRFYCFCTIYVLITLEVPLLSVSNFCQDSTWKCPFDVTCCCVWTHHYHHKGEWFSLQCRFFKKDASTRICSSLWCMCKSPQMLMNFSGYQVHTCLFWKWFGWKLRQVQPCLMLLCLCNEMKKNGLFAENWSHCTKTPCWRANNSVEPWKERTVALCFSCDTASFALTSMVLMTRVTVSLQRTHYSWK